MRILIGVLVLLVVAFPAGATEVKTAEVIIFCEEVAELLAESDDDNDDNDDVDEVLVADSECCSTGQRMMCLQKQGDTYCDDQGRCRCTK